MNKQRKGIVARRFKEIIDYIPDFVAIGCAGFRGYMIFGFSNKNIFVLESIYMGNATYVLGNDWERIAKLTKAEILSNDLQEDRFIHSDEWKMNIAKLLGSEEIVKSETV